MVEKLKISDFDKVQNKNIYTNLIEPTQSEALNLEKYSKEKKGFLYAMLASIIFGFTSFHIKLTKMIFYDSFDANIFMLWRSLSCAVLAYAIIYRKSEKLVSLSEIKKKFWFYVRIFLNYFSILSLVICIVYLRASTASCMSSMSPAIMIIFSIFILGEKFHIRYLYGVAICFVGATIIIMNEKKTPNSVEGNSKEVGYEKISDSVDPESEQIANILLGVTFGIFHIFANAIISVSQRILAVEKLSIETQCFYMGASNVLCAVVYSIITWTFFFDIKFILFTSINGLIFYYSVFYLNESFKYIELSKATPFYYLATINVFICGVLFLGEPLYFTDIIGSLLILAFNVYNSLRPIK